MKTCSYVINSITCESLYANFVGKTRCAAKKSKTRRAVKNRKIPRAAHNSEIWQNQIT